MVLAVAFDDAKTTHVRFEGDGRGATGGVTQVPFLVPRDNQDSPHASLNRYDPGRISRAHFHIADQFQVWVGGKGRLGRHDLAPYGIHFSRAYTPYGPLVADASAGLTFFVMRAHPDAGSQRLPNNLDKLKQVPDRRPWQISRSVNFAAARSASVNPGSVLQAIDGMKDEMGLAAYTLCMKPDTETCTPDPAQGDGQYLIVLKGSLWHTNKEHKTWALVFIAPGDGPFQVHAGSDGLEALVLNFPRPQARATSAAPRAQATPGFKTWQCSLCSFVYEEATGLPLEGIAPGTRWEDVPETWSCPDCSASKANFQKE